MERYFAGLDVSKDETAICVRREDGRVVFARKTLTDPEAICRTLQAVVPGLVRAILETGRMANWLHGDTFWLDRQPVSIRVFGLDAPERGQPGGSAGTATLARLIADEQLTCRPRDIDRYGRIVAQCFTADGRDITTAMIASGTAAEYCRYSGGEYETC